ncbi:AAA family ATPase [Nocardia bovistercoris]|uniref:AAA family ATPase n=1 Tax=Nocardia bovistercoris TaxID=2785916 RepID=A0A931N5C1_9NOCA|nr:AAA family ATPase [Nocardia bovistercoris]MBH0779241.1 AAA family ATPase [Nocardia bovistercoris]
MSKLLVLINGLPGAGKTTLGRSLAPALGARLLSKDAVKEALADCLDDADALPWLGGIAMDTVWAMAGASTGDVLIDSWWFAPRDLEFARAGIARGGADRVAEVWCDVPVAIARDRYRDRRRSPLHRDEQRLAEDWDAWAERAAPLGLAPVVPVDTAKPVDAADLARRIRHAASGPC